MAKTIHFNTGRQYTVHGQRITATLHDDGIVTFWDHDRTVDGEYLHTDRMENFTQAQVMTAYDHSHYASGHRSWEDGMMRGGCNTHYQA